MQPTKTVGYLCSVLVQLRVSAPGEVDTLSGRHDEAPDTGAAAQGPWPYCADIEGTCLAYDMGLHLGASIQSTLFSFILGAEEGARLTLQRNREGFTAQVTGAVQRTERDTFGLDEARAMRKHLNLERGGRKR